MYSLNRIKIKNLTLFFIPQTISALAYLKAYFIKLSLNEFVSVKHLGRFCSFTFLEIKKSSDRIYLKRILSQKNL